MDTICIVIIAAAAVLNLAVFAMYGSDKKKAEKKEWRTPEATLITGGLIAPWGALAGMYFFRHKTRKPKFKLNFLFAALHIVIAAAVLIYL